MYFVEYLYIILGSIFFFILTILVLIPSFWVSFDFIDIESTSPYECGFQPFEDTRQKFDIQFYLVAILFIIFDLEVMFLIPLALSINILTMFGIWVAILFIILLALGIVYEWRYNALDWSSEDKFFK